MTVAMAGFHLYGKLPAHGDFISRGMDRKQETAIDACLTKTLEIAQDKWGADFEEIYFAAQPWLFASDTGTAIIIPSIDKVGRKFPLYLASLKAIVLQFLYDATIEAISENHEADRLLQTLSNAPTREHASPDEPDASWFCIDPNAPTLPACWDVTNYSLRGPILTLGEVT